MSRTMLEAQACATRIAIAGSVASLERTEQALTIRGRDTRTIVGNRYEHAGVGLLYIDRAATRIVDRRRKWDPGKASLSY